LTLKIVFDEFKRRSNIEKHNYDFADLDAAFFDRSLILPARGERLTAIGRFDDTVITVVFRPLGAEGISVISMRMASKRERLRRDQA
jgi:uncharacterized DUF497 family protein